LRGYVGQPETVRAEEELPNVSSGNSTARFESFLRKPLAIYERAEEVFLNSG
jgi:hypothetical protein